ncbi:MAG: FAD-dependent oxidoreductase [Candidatus Saccharimonadales bacterium]
MQVFYESRRELAPTIWEYSFRPERRVDFVPGQYVNLGLEAVTNDQRGKSRTLTIVSLPDEPSLRFIVKHPENQSIYKQRLADLLPGTAASITDAMGDVILPKLTSIPLVFVAGGIGFASFISILQYLEKTGETRKITLLYGRRNKYELLYPELVKRFPFTARQLYITPQRLTPQDILSAAHDDAVVFISGGEKFVEDLTSQLRIAGLGSERMVFDFFDGYTEDQI